MEENAVQKNLSQNILAPPMPGIDPGPLACQATVEVSRPDFMGLGLFSVSSLKGLGLVSVSTFKGLGVETTLSRLQGMKKHSVGGRFQYPQ